MKGEAHPIAPCGTCIHCDGPRYVPVTAHYGCCSEPCAHCCGSRCIHVAHLIAGLRAEMTEKDAALATLEAKRSELQERVDVAEAALAAEYERGRSDERREVIAEVERAIRMYEHAGAPDEVRVLTAIRDDIETLTHHADVT